ncbi:cytochrome c551/cytochrome c550 [Virgibacillus subterraneus]|uniref:Cytochrome c551/cytochrome c550 n=1 Tax=Virgibacillus subterraneus TaxID=621109 RepID=A0A1H9DXR6_9BACI|nr:cytochrome c [Virgibacillus subterraneus]SEQ18255.1 cytochrome c551/cytochrome c550 [Virgibacillus subterraneus]
MKKNPVIPYATIAVIGILLVVVISFVGLDQRQTIEKKEKNGGENTEEKSQEGETTSDPSKVFESNCASCHGADLSGGMGPALNKVGSKYSQEEIREIIKTGFPDAGMQGNIIQGEKADAVAKWLSEQK